MMPAFYGFSCEIKKCGAEQEFESPDVFSAIQSARDAGWLIWDDGGGRLCPTCAAVSVVDDQDVAYYNQFMTSHDRNGRSRELIISDYESVGLDVETFTKLLSEKIVITPLFSYRIDWETTMWVEDEYLRKLFIRLRRYGSPDGATFQCGDELPKDELKAKFDKIIAQLRA